MKPQVRLYDFNYQDVEKEEEYEEDEEGKKKFGCNKVFRVQMFGLDEKGEDYSFIIDDFKPSFYIKVHDSWRIDIKNAFLDKSYRFR